jgi:hypothetical protein
METLRYLNKVENINERQNFSNWWKEQINIYGQDTTYHVYNSSLTGVNVIYGEEPNARFEPGMPLIVLLNLNNDALSLSKFGFVVDSDLAGVIHYESFMDVFGSDSEPKAGDVLVLEEYGIDRLNYPKRGPTRYQLTEVIDEFQGNPLAGHYVWFIKGKRYDYSFEPGMPGNGGVGNTPSDDNDAVEDVAKNNFDYQSLNPCSNTAVYGNYETPERVAPLVEMPPPADENKDTGFIYELL